jgi:hemoglobin/transferrin/lactoferrin receptor protein
LNGEYAYSLFGNKDLKFSNARENTTADYITLEQVGTEWLTPSFPEEVCQIAPIACEPFESPVMAPVKHAGSESVGRKMSNSLDTHTFKIGLNYRF